MDSTTQILLAAGTTAAAVYFLANNKSKLSKIPGPRGIPIFGNALQLDKDQPNETLRKWADQFGDVMKINLFGQEIVIVNGYEAVNELLVTKSGDFAGRPDNWRTNTIYLGRNNDLAFADFSPTWNILKKSCMKGLKMVGEKNTELEEIVQTFTNELVKTMRMYDGQTVDIADDLRTAIAHITFTLVYGRELPLDERDTFKRTSDDLMDLLNPASEYGYLDIVPWLRGPWFRKYTEFMRVCKESETFYKRQVNKTVEQYNNEVQCVIDGLIEEHKSPSTPNVQLTMNNLYGTANNMTLAGVETTYRAMYFLISLLAANPEIQEQAYQSILDKIGNKAPTLQDRGTIPFIESMILELLRFISHIPFSVPHKSLVDTTLVGYDIPKDTQIWPNLWFLHHDNRLWDNPWEFLPKRYLDNQGNLVTADHPLRKQFFAFGAGRRVCAGETMAKLRMFILIVMLLQNFIFEVPEGETIETDPRKCPVDAALHQKNYQVKLLVRK